MGLFGLPRLLLATPRPVHPADNGGDLRVQALLRRLAPRYRITLLTFTEPASRTRELAAALALERELGITVELVAREPSGPPAAWMPPEFDHFRSPRFAERVRELAARSDLVQLEFSELAQYARAAAAAAPVVLTEHDTSVLAREGSYLDRSGGPSPDWARRRGYLRRCLPSCRRVVVVSEPDRRRLQAFAPDVPVEVVPTGVDLARFAFTAGRGRRPGSLVFVGHYRHYPNEDAAIFLAEQVLPRVLRGEPSARLRLVGSGPTDEVRALASAAVEVTGPVPDVQPYLASARVFIAPLRLGSGIKGKLLEAFAAGTPVVATPEASEGIPEARAGVHLLLGRSPAELASQVLSLLRDAKLRGSLASRARALVERDYSWDLQADRLERVYRSLLTEREPAAAGERR